MVGIASDVVICYVIGLLVFGRSHPALHFLLLLTVAQDVLALTTGAIFAPQPEAHNLLWVALSPLAALLVWAGFGRLARRDATEVAHQRAATLWPYILAGAVSWTGFSLAGLPPELGLLPIIPAIPHAARSFGIFAEAEVLLHDPLNRLTNHLIKPLIFTLFLFGLTRGGISLQAFGPGSQTIMATLWLGKPLGLICGAAIALTFGRGVLPEGLRLSDITC